jgi:hypothetical protein
MHVRVLLSIVIKKVMEKIVPVIVASGTGGPFTSKYDLILCETGSNG